MYKELKNLRESKGYSNRDMGSIINKSPCNYLKKENGDVKFSVSEAIAIANFLKVKVETIFFTKQLSEDEKRE